MSAAQVKWVHIKIGVPRPGDDTGGKETFFVSEFYDIQMNDDIFTIQSRHPEKPGHTCFPMEQALSFELELIDDLYTRGFDLADTDGEEIEGNTQDGAIDGDKPRHGRRKKKAKKADAEFPEGAT